MSLLAEYVDQDFGLVRSGDQWAKTVAHDSFVVDLIRNYWFWNSKGERGNTEDYLVKIRGMSTRDAKNLILASEGDLLVSYTNKTDAVPYKALVDILWKNGRTERDYWYHRCLTDKTINRFRLGYYNNVSTVPIYRDGELINIQCRRDDPKTVYWWYKETDVSNVLFQGDILKYVDTVYIVEGLVDSILLSQFNIPSVAPTGGNLGWKTDWFKKFIRTKNIYVVGDNDKAGMIFMNRVADSIGKYRVKCVSFEDKKKGFDSVDFFRDGGTPEDYVKYVKENSYNIHTRS